MHPLGPFYLPKNELFGPSRDAQSRERVDRALDSELTLPQASLPSLYQKTYV